MALAIFAILEKPFAILEFRGEETIVSGGIPGKKWFFSPEPVFSWNDQSYSKSNSSGSALVCMFTIKTEKIVVR